ncbi:MAG: NAD(P)H nitroreductase [Candidatus Dactylopiibacterium carminicum]|uniref:NAD(P)H nitroreductase n=1 Tax=Candidatus Dactylopiibacterium carminicum TaxID=857335 RepID=A0A272EQV3_9RHOO|nr:oxygen-insensitive NAD(P)H nitroreductase [Candidatus Dactylopiibacterium carminicum]KAF7600726.1 oxygen-insensitive NAD(P)H nitroreductase [Candidatus Dactylopiibacterium carminicum]PAS92485.1 MAG: NAD(P)H nitroreductase [Candidatus Dactylopiibacterium carminicum]PAS96055.1 MAG: NAD(P)H nitroreductase [Candidatus Dactylopiibacterium carminicum]PAT00732.1 MAG: NAD(P)H nitroreductase [Candidatus Dactylopiibacterium carminicum]
MKISEIVHQRRATKAFHPTRKIPAEAVAELEELLRFSPSSINSQPWHFVVAGSDEGKARVAKATYGSTAYNAPKILNASYVVVFCARQDFDDAHLAAVIDQEEVDGRIANAEAKAGQLKGRGYYVNLHRFDRKDAQHWMEKQVYIAVGTLLLGAAALDVDACPIEGFDATVLDEELGLRARGLTSVVIVALGYSGGEDFNAKLPKSRLPVDRVISRI